MRYDVAVIGGGHNGLTAAFYLARAGLSTVVLERREILGGCCVTEEIDRERAPGCRVSTASYMASMLRPEVIHDLELDRHGLKMIAASPTVQAVTPDGVVLPWWSDHARMREMLRQFAPTDCERFLALEGRLAGLARHLEPLFMEAPPDLEKGGFAGFRELLGLALRFRGLRGREIPDLVAFATGSLGEFLDRSLDSPHLKSLILANSLYGKHGGPYDPGTLFGLLFHLLGGGAEAKQGFVGHVMGGMGAITAAMAAACRSKGVELRTDAEVAAIRVSGGRALGVTLADGSAIDAGIVVSNADPRRTYLNLTPEGALDPEFLAAVRGIKMDGPCGKLNLVLGEEPVLERSDPAADALQRSQFTLVPWLDGAQAAYGEARRGRIAEELWIDCLVPSLIDPLTRDPGAARDDLLHPVPALSPRGIRMESRAGETRGAAIAPDHAIRAGRRPVANREPPLHAIRSRERLRHHRRQHLPRRPAAGSALLHAADTGPCALRIAAHGALSLRRRHASGRRRDGCARPQRGAADSRRPETRPRAAQGPEVVNKP